MQPGYKSPAQSDGLEGIRAAYGTMPVDYKSPEKSDGLEGIRAAYGNLPVDYKSPAQSDGLEGIRTQVYRTVSDVTGRGIAAGIRAAKDRYNSSIWETIMNTVNQWGVNVSKWLSARQFEQDNVLTKIGLGSWGRLGTAAAAAGALAAAYYAWKKWNKKREGENTPMVPANASFMPEFSDYIANEAERFDVAMCTAMTLLTEAVADGVADGQITARVNQMIASIKRDADKAARVLASIAQDQDASKAPPELMEQMAAVASMLEERNAA